MGLFQCPRRRRTENETAFIGGVCSAVGGPARGPNFSWDNPRLRDRSLGRRRRRSDGQSAQRGHWPGAHHRSPARDGSYCRARIAHRHLLRHRNADRLRDLCGDRSHRRRGLRTPRRCRPQDRSRSPPGRSFRGRPAHGRDDDQRPWRRDHCARPSRICPSMAATTPSSSISIPAWPVLPTRSPTLPAPSASSP